VPTVVGVRLRFTPKVLYFDPRDTTPVEGDAVIVETERGTEIGEVVAEPHEIEESALPAPLKPVVRIATENDLVHAEVLAGRETEAMSNFRNLVREHELDMKPVAVECLFDEAKIVFYFSAEERVDFRALVRDLASRLKTRVDMRQIGVRDEARIVGGLGHCGEQLCCVRFPDEFQPVSIRMAKEQDLPLNPLKISGLCGRLMCCLRYEYDAYKDFKTRAPKRGSLVETPAGEGKVVELNTPQESVTLRLEDGTKFAVPLSSMECGKGGSCPCLLTQKAMDELRVGPLSSVSVTVPEKPAEEKKSKRRPRSRGAKGSQKAGSESGGKQAKSQGEKAGANASGKQAGSEKQAAAPTSKSPGRRRRRRRRGPSEGDKKST